MMSTRLTGTFGGRTGMSLTPAPIKKKTSILVYVDDVLKAMFHFEEGLAEGLPSRKSGYIIGLATDLWGFI